MNNGQWRITEQHLRQRLDYWLGAANRLGSRMRALDALERGKVLVNGEVQTLEDAARELQAGDVVRVWMEPPSDQYFIGHERPVDYLDIIHEDRHLLALNKPAGLLSTPHPYSIEEDSLFELVEEYLNTKKRQPLVVHRIDRGTTGLVLFAKTIEAQARLRAQFERREPQRIYWAVTHGIPAPEDGEWRDWMKFEGWIRRPTPAVAGEAHAIEARCHYRVLERFASTALIEVRLHTGKRNQIRLQAWMHGHPLVGEPTFRDPSTELSDAIPFGRQALHAYRLRLRHPMTNRELKLEAPLPDDFTDLLARLAPEGKINCKAETG
jgi:23S rRNA pseudouridine1911/1915/1917 synthase